MTIQTPTSNLPEFGAPMSGLPDDATLNRLANAFFSALPGHSAGAVPAAAQPPANPLPAGASIGPLGNGPALPGTLAPGANAAPTSLQDVAAIAAAQPGRAPKAEAGNGVPDLVYTSAPALDSRFGGAALSAPEPLSGSATPSFYFLGQDPGYPSNIPPPTGAPAQVPSAAQAFDFADPHALGALLGVGSGSGSGTAPSAPPQPATASGTGLERYYFAEHVVSVGPSGGPSGLADPVPHAQASAHPAFDVHAVRRDFPALSERVNGRPLAWFDNAATTQKPRQVIDRLSYFYQHENSNIHRAAHTLAARATDAYEGARKKVQRFIGAGSDAEIVFVRGTTEAINLVAATWGDKHIAAGDEIILSQLEHHANIVPWQMLAQRKGARIRVIPVDDSGQVLLEEFKRLLGEKTKLVSVTQVSNALGTVVPVREIVEMAHRAGAKALIDGAQSVSHMAVDVRALDADFFVFSGHKIFGPTGIGALYGKRELLEDMPPYQGGGNMIQDVTFEKTVYQGPPTRFEAGTGNIADAVGLGAALDYVQRIGIENIGRYEHDLLAYATHHLRPIPGVRLIGTARDKASVLSFVLDGHTTDEVGQALNREGIAVRTGHHCAQPILRRFGLETTVRPSLAFYNTCEEVDRFIAVVQQLSTRRAR